MANEVITCYESIAATSGVMLEAARTADWDRLIAAERECANLVARLRTLGPPSQLSGSEVERRRTLLHEVLENDAEIRRLTQPWVAQLERLLSGASAARRVQETYR